MSFADVIVVMMVIMVMAMFMVMAVVLPDATHVVVVADLWQSHDILVAGKLHAILTELAIHVRAALNDFPGPIEEDIEEERVGLQVIGREEFGLGMERRELG